jgi:hypothetical protein
MNFKMQFLIHFWAPMFEFEFWVFGCPFTTIVRKLEWVEMIKSLGKGDISHILQKIWNTLNLDFLKF